MNALHQFKALHIDQDCQGVRGYHDNELFFNCLFNSVKGLTLKDCDLSHSRFNVDTIREALGFTLTLSCSSFRSVTYSELMMDLMLFLLTTTDGNEERRKQIEGILGEDKVKTFQRVLRSIE